MVGFRVLLKPSATRFCVWAPCRSLNTVLGDYLTRIKTSAPLYDFE